MIYSQIKKPTSTAGSLTGWTNIDNMLLDDGVQAVSQTTGHNTNAPYLKLSACDGDPIPLDATIVGIAVKIEAKCEFTGATGFFCMGASPSTGSGGLQLRGVTGAIGRGMTAFKTSTLTTKIIGGDADLWGSTEITPEQVNDPAFGLYALFRNGNTTPQKMFIDHIQLEVFYTLPEPEQGIGGNGPVKPPAP